MLHGCYTKQTYQEETKRVYTVIHNSHLDGPVQAVIWIRTSKDEEVVELVAKQKLKVAAIRLEHWLGAEDID